MNASKGCREGGGKIGRAPPPHRSVSAVLKIEAATARALPNPLHAVILFFNTSRENRSSREREDPA